MCSPHRIDAGVVSDLLGLFGERGGFGHFEHLISPFG
jgi:hypothetical protein